jgi:hypothetical protein
MLVPLPGCLIPGYLVPGCLVYLDVQPLDSWYLDVRSPGDDGEVDGENDDEDQDAGEEEEPMLSPEFHAWNKPLFNPASASPLKGVLKKASS